MKKLVIAIAVSAAALVGGSAANADTPVKREGATIGTSQSTDFSAHRRHHRHGHRHHRHYRSYGYYAPRRVYHAPRVYYAPQPYYRSYGYGGPSISFGFGGGHYGGHHGRHHW